MRLLHILGTLNGMRIFSHGPNQRDWVPFYAVHILLRTESFFLPKYQILQTKTALVWTQNIPQIWFQKDILHGTEMLHFVPKGRDLGSK